MITHNFKKKFGQNFISDKNLLRAICEDAQISETDEVLEIGAGAGSLTQILSSRAKKVVSYEIDRDLEQPLLSLNLENTTFKFADIMKFSLEEIEKDFEGSYKMVANLPYYISSPIIFKFLSSTKLKQLTIMVQKEVAERITAKAGDKDYGLLSVMTAFYGLPTICRNVSRKMFYPQPKVDSAIVNIKLRPKNIDVDDKNFQDFVCTIFSMRRKTLKNNLLKDEKLKDKLICLDEKTLSKRAEEFNLDQLLDIYLKIFK